MYKIMCSKCNYSEEHSNYIELIESFNKYSGIFTLAQNKCKYCNKYFGLQLYFDNQIVPYSDILPALNDYYFKPPKVQPTKYNKNKTNRIKQRRKEREEQAEGSFTKEEFLLKCEERGYKCHYCNEIFPPFRLVPEHLTPLCRGGKNSIDNIEPSCYRCNIQKGRKTEDEYRKWLKTKIDTSAEYH
jgi:5-methylcytosine-specific restriction endonuclease McrA